MNKQIISNFCLVCYYDNKTKELVRIEQYNDNDSSMYSDIDSYKYGYNAKIVKPEEIIKQLKAKEKECEELKNKLNCCFCNPHVELNDIEKLRKCVEETECFRRQLDQLKSDNEELKKELEAVYDDCKGCSTCNEALYNANLYAKEYRKLKTTLQEIKEIAGVNKNYKFKITESVCIGDTVELKFDVLEQILNKIKEVENDF